MSDKTYLQLAMMLWLGLILAGCSQVASSQPPAQTENELQIEQTTPVVTPSPTLPPTANPTTDGPTTAELASPSLTIPKPENNLTDGEYGWSQLLARDAILPIYEPEFAPADEAPYSDEELVIGVAINGEAKAYAIGPLNSREMVNDTLGGRPILVTW